MTSNLRGGVVGFGSVKFQQELWQPCHEQMLSECPPAPVNEKVDPSCDKLDLMVVFPQGVTNTYYPAAFTNALSLFADYVAANTTDYQLGAVTVGASGSVSVLESLSLNNVTSFKASIASPGTATESLSKDINGAMETAVDGTAGTWRTASDVRKYIFYLGRVLPGGNNDTYSSTDEDEFLQAITDGLNNDDITTSLIEVELGNVIPSAANLAEIQRIYTAGAAAGQGRFVKQGPTTPLLATMLLVLDSLCYTDDGFEGDGYTSTSHLLCCKTAVCKLCLEFDVYGEDLQYGYADWDGEAYVGTIAGATFRAYWAVRDICYLFVEIDGVIEAAFPMCETEDTYDGDATGCRSPGGSFDVTIGTGYTAQSGTLTFRAYKPKRLRRTFGVLGGECIADVAILLDSNWRNTPGVEDLQGTDLQPMIDYLSANFDSYRLALIKLSVGISSHELVTDFSLNNGSTFLSDLNAITPAGGSTLTVDEHRRSDGAMAIAVNDLTWRTGAIKKIILLNQGRPGASTPVADDNSYELAQLNVAGSAPLSLISVDCLTIPYVNATSWPPTATWEYGPGNQRINIETAQAGNGGHVTVTAVDGAAGYNGGTNVFAPAVTARVESMSCETNGACASIFCDSFGDAECTCEKLCLFVSYYDGGELQCQASGTLDWAALDDCAALGTTTPRWDGELNCIGLEADTLTANVYLGKDEYGRCIVYGDITGYTFSADLEAQLVEPDQMTASWVIDDGYTLIEVSVECQTCGECVGVDTDCCANPIPRTLYVDVDVTTPSPGPNPDDCSCAAGTYAMGYSEGSGLAGGTYAHWTTGSIRWNCPNPAYDAMTIELRCLTSVWHIDIFLLLNGSVVKNASSSSPDPASTCDPFEQLFPESAYFDGGCQPGLVPDLVTLTVTE